MPVHLGEFVTDEQGWTWYACHQCHRLLDLLGWSMPCGAAR